MYSLSYLRRQVNALMRKFAVQLAVAKLRPVADEYCDQWEELVAGDQLPPDPHRLFQKILPRETFRRQYFPAIYNYLDRCRLDRHLPHPNKILSRLVPKAAGLGLVPSPCQPLAY